MLFVSGYFLVIFYLHTVLKRHMAPIKGGEICRLIQYIDGFNYLRQPKEKAAFNSSGAVYEPRLPPPPLPPADKVER